jgi:hypothetical protein
MPPLLWRSWMLLIEASHDHPPLVPADTWRRASRPLPMRPFLSWTVAESSDDDVEAEVAREVTRVLENAAPQALDRSREPGREDAGAGPQATGERRLQLSRQLGRQLMIPRAAIDEIAGR